MPSCEKFDRTSFHLIGKKVIVKKKKYDIIKTIFCNNGKILNNEK